MNRIKFLREEKDLNQADIGKLLGITSQAVGLYENGKREISFTSNLSDLVGYTLKLVDNSTTKTITFIIK